MLPSCDRASPVNRLVVTRQRTLAIPEFKSRLIRKEGRLSVTIYFPRKAVF